MIHNEVSSEEVQTSKVPVPISKEVLSVAPIMSGHPFMFVLGSTTPEENELLVKESMVYFGLRYLSPEDVTKVVNSDEIRTCLITPSRNNNNNRHVTMKLSET